MGDAVIKKKFFASTNPAKELAELCQNCDHGRPVTLARFGKTIEPWDLARASAKELASFLNEYDERVLALVAENKRLRNLISGR